MKIAVVGSSTFNDEKHLRSTIEEYGASGIISGVASGSDRDAAALTKGFNCSRIWVQIDGCFRIPYQRTFQNLFWL